MPAATSLFVSSIWKNFFNLGIFQAAGMLLQLLAVPLITARYGLPVFGEVALSASLAVFFSNLVNYSTNQTAVKEVSLHKNDPTALSLIYSQVLVLRLVVFLIVMIVAIILLLVTNEFFGNLLSRESTVFSYFLAVSILPLIAAEIFNPLFFLNGVEKIHWISWGNLVARAVSLMLIWSIPLNGNSAVMLNLMMYLPLLGYYLMLCWLVMAKFDLNISTPGLGSIRRMLQDNFYVVFNNSSVVLQQSIFMFTVAGIASPQMLGAYGIIDRLLASVRQVVSAFSSAIYPHAVRMYHTGTDQWMAFRSSVQKGYWIVFTLAAILIYLSASPLTIFFTGSADSVTILFFRCFSLAPLALALNANNVLDLLLSDSYRQMFFISVLILLATLLISFVLTNFFSESAIGFYPLIIEAACLLIYSLYPRTAANYARI